MAGSVQDGFKPGARVRYRYGSRDSGTLLRKAHPYRGQDRGWMVRWDNDPHGPRLLQAHDENMELIPGEDAKREVSA
jgi:hypothetical protein